MLRIDCLDFFNIKSIRSLFQFYPFSNGVWPLAGEVLLDAIFSL